ncbi:hypothetical protein Anas_06471 [Armadillidium nasatum]|uniref:Uncharacterized protein n=1 Tax=Armadillidium nasatum TaxID=96803 RepID=A0A5N5TPC2_9CRUS|nr:hypothetical protein Anas_06471 [Armadillidium nasatum]
MVGLKVHFPGDLTINKFRPRYYGPYKIIQVHPNRVTYIIEADHLGKQYRVHHRQLRKWKLPPEYLRNEFEFRDIMKSDEERQANIREEPNLVVEESEEQPQQSFANPEEEDDEEGFFEGFEVDEEKLKQVKETLFRLTQVQTQLITVVREGLSQEDPDIVVTEEEEEINSFLLWDTSDLLDEAERRWELTQARILSSYIVERESLPNNFNLLDPNRYSTPLLRPEGVEKDGVLENEQENIRITYQNSGSFEGFEPEEPPMIHGVERQIEIPTFGPYTPTLAAELAPLGKLKQTGIDIHRTFRTLYSHVNTKFLKKRWSYSSW